MYFLCSARTYVSRALMYTYIYRYTRICHQGKYTRYIRVACRRWLVHRSTCWKRLGQRTGWWDEGGRQGNGEILSVSLPLSLSLSLSLCLSLSLSPLPLLPHPFSSPLCLSRPLSLSFSALSSSLFASLPLLFRRESFERPLVENILPCCKETILEQISLDRYHRASFRFSCLVHQREDQDSQPDRRFNGLENGRRTHDGTRRGNIFRNWIIVSSEYAGNR